MLKKHSSLPMLNFINSVAAQRLKSVAADVFSSALRAFVCPLHLICYAALIHALALLRVMPENQGQLPPKAMLEYLRRGVHVPQGQSLCVLP